jgi:hypothetical protein
MPFEHAISSSPISVHEGGVTFENTLAVIRRCRPGTLPAPLAIYAELREAATTARARRKGPRCAKQRAHVRA